ncbi:MAG: hypothetical protein ACD_42C00566G0003 [uncultured bacterium]|nr:MAG: hypothetical protein ACD_42C00566G0003 [uncultured bacterium]
MQNGCYRCVKPGRYGFHAYPRQVDRSTCNANTVNYLRNMGYNCYHNTESSPCVKAVEKESCDWDCAKYAKKYGD